MLPGQVDLRDVTRAGYPRGVCTRAGMPLRDVTRAGMPLRDVTRAGYPRMVPGQFHTFNSFMRRAAEMTLLPVSQKTPEESLDLRPVSENVVKTVINVDEAVLKPHKTVKSSSRHYSLF